MLDSDESTGRTGAPRGTVDTRFDPIHSAARNRDAGRVRELLASGVEVDSLNGRAPNGDGGNTALWFAAQGPSPGGLEAAQALIEAGAEINRPCEHGCTALHMASAWGHLDVVKYLLSRGADALIRSADGDTPADMARAKHHQHVVDHFASLGL